MSTIGFLARLAIAGVIVIFLIVLQTMLDEAEHARAPCAAQRCA